MVHGVRLHGHGIHAQITFPSPGWSLPRCVLDQALLDAALSEGATLTQAHVEGCADAAHCAQVAIRLPDGSVESLESSAVVAADGMHSVVARKCGFARPAQKGLARFALGGHYRGFARLDGYIDMFVDGRSYLAINPLSDETANVMLVVDASELQAHRDDVDAFAEERARRLAGDLFANAQLERKRIAIGPLAYRAERLAGHHVALAGDAACFLDPFTGQGVYLALRCAGLAADCILNGSLRHYERRAYREIHARERSARRISRIIGSPLFARAGASLLRGAPWLLRPLVASVAGAA